MEAREATTIVIPEDRATVIPEKVAAMMTDTAKPMVTPLISVLLT
jgi:hypothetical protein